MARNSYQDQLESLRADVLAMSDLVVDRLEDALRSLETRDAELAESVVTGDHAVNDLYLELEGECIDLFALQQPVAGDLRFIASSFKVVTDLERIGDLATNLAGYAMAAERERYPEIDVVHLGERTVELVEDAMAAYEAGDAAATREIAARDDEIDDLCEHASELVVRDLLERDRGAAADGIADEPLADDAMLEDVSRTLLTIRDLERVGDHAVNIAARTLYMVENDDELIY